LSEAQIPLPSSNTPKDIFDLWKQKLQAGFLPPDPAEVVDYLGQVIASLEHATILPPLAEYLEVNLGEKLTDSLPRLPETPTFPRVEFLKYYKAPGEINMR
jgi:hypothetical protein